MPDSHGSNLLASVISGQDWGKSLLRQISDARCQCWDWMHGVDTIGTIPLATLAFESKNKDEGLEYSSPHPQIIRSSLTSLPLAHRDYTFVDMGCGKGRVLLLASELPFRRIVGIEFATPLAEIAQHNLRSYRWNIQRCRDVAVVTGDATEWELPPEPTVLFFANPFFPNVMRQVIENLERSFLHSPHDLFVLFVGLLSRRDSSFGAQPQYERLRRERYFDLYRHRPAMAAEHARAA
jgi:SAM-dependent methyltransferase